MNIDQLKYLADLAKTNSMNETAKRMYIAQPAVSKSIKRLEHELGCTLLNRSKTGIEFTDDGIVILEYAQNILGQYRHIEQYLQMKYSKNHLQGKLVIGVGPAISDTLLPKLLLKMHRYYPDITLQVIEASSDAILELLNDAEIDFGIFGFGKDNYYDTSAKPLTQFCFQKLYTDATVAVMAKNNPLSLDDTITLEKLMEHKHTSYGYNFTQLAEHDVLHISNNAKLHQQFMLEEGAVCTMPYQTYLENYAHKNFVAKSIADVDNITNYLIYQKAAFHENEAIYQTFIETALSLVTELQ